MVNSINVRAQFRIKSILALTLVVAVLMAFRSWAIIGLGVLLFLVHLAMLLGPIAIVLASFRDAKQEGTQVEVSDNDFITLLLRGWLSSVAIVCLSWLIFFTYYYCSSIYHGTQY